MELTVRVSFAIVSTVLQLAASARANAQVRPVQDAVEVAKQLRTRGEAGPALRILTGSTRVHTPQQIDAVADSMVAFAISFPGDRSSTRTSRNSAILALLYSGTTTEATPYVGAFARLLRIAERAADASDRGSAIFALAQLPDKARSVRVLSDIAISQNPAAFVAVQELWGSLANDGGLGALRDLHRTGLVRERGALRELDWVASKNGWR